MYQVQANIINLTFKIKPKLFFLNNTFENHHKIFHQLSKTTVMNEDIRTLISASSLSHVVENMNYHKEKQGNMKFRRRDKIQKQHKRTKK